jgi:hypothetical protein
VTSTAAAHERNTALRPTDAWTPPPADVVWFEQPLARAHYLVALRHHNENLYAECVEWLAMWRSELVAEAAA